MGEMIKVGMADLNICAAPNAITTLGLGSCVGVVLYDPGKKYAGLLHAMLPDSTKIRNNENVAKFVDSGLDELIRRMIKMGANRSAFVAKLAGGAQMFSFGAHSGSQDLMRIGERNAEEARANLKRLGIRLLAEDCGLNFGRTIEFYPENGQLLIKAVGKPPRTI
jgi:chemotaxis protein CheD